jgi:hypothetical protein
MGSLALVTYSIQCGLPAENTKENTTELASVAEPHRFGGAVTQCNSGGSKREVQIA